MNSFNIDILKDKSCIICFKDFTTHDDLIDIEKGLDDVNLIKKLSQKIDSQIIVGLRCEHFYHYNCIITWFRKKKNCPTCRQDVSAYIIV